MEKRNLRKERIGVVTSCKVDTSIVVAEVNDIKHPMSWLVSEARYARSSMPNLIAKAGDKVPVIKQTVPISPTKTWAVRQLNFLIKFTSSSLMTV